MTIQELRPWINKKIEENPELKEEIFDFYSLCRTEIEDGGSEPHEIELCISSVEELIKEKENAVGKV